MSGDRRLIVPQQTFTPGKIMSVQNDAGAEMTHQDATRPAVRADANAGMLNPIPMGTPDGAYSTDIRIRAPGNPGGARWAQRDTSTTTKYKGKAPAHIWSDVWQISHDTSAATSQKHPKMLVTPHGNLLMMWVDGTTGDFAYQLKQKTGAFGVVRTLTFSSTDSVISVDAVMYPDNKEMVLIVAGYSLGVIWLKRYSAVDDDTATWLFAQTPISYFGHGGGITRGFASMAIERMGNGRMVMLAQFVGSAALTDGLQRAISDDRGVHWSTWRTAGSYGQIPTDFASEGFGAGVVNQTSHGTGGIGALGIVDITRTEAGALLAVAPCTAGNEGSGTSAGTPPDVAPDGGDGEGIYLGPINGHKDRIRCLVSDNGDDWADMLTYSRTTVAGRRESTPTGLMGQGQRNAAVVVGDDGLPRIFAALHGDSNGSRSGAFFDDLAMLSLRKSSITARDVGPVPQFPGDTDTNARVTVSDAFDTGIDSETGLFSPTVDEITPTRICSLVGEGTGNLDVTGAATFRGIREVAAINWRGALYLLLDCEAVATDYALILVRCNDWSRLDSRPDKKTLVTSIIKGSVYDECWFPIAQPQVMDVDYVRTLGTGSVVMDPTEGGMQVNTVGDPIYWTRVNLGGDAGRPTFARFICQPTSGGDDAAANISYELVLTNGLGGGAERNAGVKIYMDATAVRAVDATSGATLGVGTNPIIGDYALGVEVEVAMSAFNTIEGIHARPITADNEDGEWSTFGITRGTTVNSATVSTAERERFGHIASVTAESIWRKVMFTRGITGSIQAYPQFRSEQTAYESSTDYPEFNDVELLGAASVGHDDGLTHGTRAPACRAMPQYLRQGSFLSWVGSAAVVGDTWAAISSYDYSLDRVHDSPVRSIWRSAGDATEVNCAWDMGASGAALLTTNPVERLNPEVICLLKVRSHDFSVQMSAASNFAAPTMNVRVNCLDTADVRRDHYRRLTGTFTVDGDVPFERTLRFTGAAANILAPHALKSDDNVEWFMYSQDLDQSFRIVDNDDHRVFFEEPINGCDAAGFVSFYPDHQYVDTPTANFGGGKAGSRYFRVRFELSTVAGNLLADGTMSGGYHSLGLVVPGNAYPLYDPHPAGGYSDTYQAETSVLRTLDGHVRSRQLGPGRRLWSYAWQTLHGRNDRTDLETAPGDPAGFERLRALLKGINFGETVCVLMPFYLGDTLHTDGGIDMHAVRVLGALQLTQLGIEAHDNDSLRQDLADGAPLVLEEVL